MVSPQHKKKAARFLVAERSVSMRWACDVIQLSRSTFFFKSKSDTRRWIAFKAGYRLTHQDVLETLNQAIVEHGRPENIRSDNGPEFIAKK